MPELLDKRLIFVTGKGGVGKTTVAAALGAAAAERGKRTIVCEMAGQERMARLFERDGAGGDGGVGFRETELADRLWAISIHPERSLEEYLRLQIGSRALSNLLTGNRMFQYLAAAAPGVRELSSIAKVWELAQLQRRSAKASPYDLVVVDAPATGHGLGMLRAPRTFGDIARVGPIRRQADLIDSFIRDQSKTGVLVVALAEEMPVNETLDFQRSLGEVMGLEIDAIVVNAVYPERFSGADAEALSGFSPDGSRPALRAALEAALSEHHRARAQRAQLRRLRRGAESEVTTLPFLFEPELGPESVERLSRELERKL